MTQYDGATATIDTARPMKDVILQAWLAIEDAGLRRKLKFSPRATIDARQDMYRWKHDMMQGNVMVDHDSAQLKQVRLLHDNSDDALEKNAFTVRSHQEHVKSQDKKQNVVRAYTKSHVSVNLHKFAYLANVN